MIQQTSIDAFREIQPQLGKREYEVYLVIKSYHPVYDDWTNREIAQFLDLDACSVTGRTNSLVKKGLVVRACVRRCEVTGFKAIAWKARA